METVEVKRIYYIDSVYLDMQGNSEGGIIIRQSKTQGYIPIAHIRAILDEYEAVYTADSTGKPLVEIIDVNTEGC